MQVILLKDVKGVGQRNAIKEVTDGYALNYLLPRGLAQQATKESLAIATKRQQAEEHATKVNREKVRSVLKHLDGRKITLETKANHQGHLFKGVRADDVASAILETAEVSLDPDMITLGAKVIKNAGEYPIHIVGEGMDVAVTLVVEVARNTATSH